MKKKTLLQEMTEALQSHGPAHAIACAWFDKRKRRIRKQRRKTANKDSAT